MADWKKISDFPSYEVSNEGEVRNCCHSAVSFHLAGKAKRPRFEYADEGGIYNGQQA